MKVEQIFALTNDVTREALGESVILKEDLSNLVDVGKELLDATSTENFVYSIMDKIGKVQIVNRVYLGKAPRVMMDGWLYGSIKEKIGAEMPEARENTSWDLRNGDHDQNKFYEPEVSVKFFNSKVTFEIDRSVADIQVRSAFHSAQKMNEFLSMLSTVVANAITIKLEELIRRTINSMIADTMFDAFGGAPTSDDTSTRAINLLKLYKEESGHDTLTAEDALTNPEFIRFASYKMKLYMSRLSSASRMFNMGGKVRFTPNADLHVIMLTEFKSAADVYLQSDTYNKELTALPESEDMPYWQGSGLEYEFASTSKINVTSGSGNEIETDGVLCVMFDREALGVTNQDNRVTTHYNAKSEFTNYFHKTDVSYFNDANENFIVFFVK